MTGGGVSVSFNAGTEHTGFSPTRQASGARSVKRREVFDESRERKGRGGRAWQHSRTSTSSMRSSSRGIRREERNEGQRGRRGGG